MAFQRGLISFDERIESDAGAAVGERDDGGVAHGRVLADQRGQHRRIIDQAAAAGVSAWFERGP